MSLEIIQESFNLIQVRDEGDNEYWITRDRFETLKFKESGKTTAEERARRSSKYCTDFENNSDIFGASFDPCKNSELLSKFESQANSWVLVIGSGPESYERVCKELRQLGLEQPERYVRRYPKGHAEKYDLLVPDPKIPDVDFELGLFFNYRRLLSTGRYQIGRTEFALRNLSKIGRILEVNEKIPEVK